MKNQGNVAELIEAGRFWECFGIIDNMQIHAIMVEFKDELWPHIQEFTERQKFIAYLMDDDWKSINDTIIVQFLDSYLSTLPLAMIGLLKAVKTLEFLQALGYSGGHSELMMYADMQDNIDEFSDVSYVRNLDVVHYGILTQIPKDKIIPNLNLSRYIHPLRRFMIIDTLIARKQVQLTYPAITKELKIVLTEPQNYTQEQATYVLNYRHSYAKWIIYAMLVGLGEGYYKVKENSLFLSIGAQLPEDIQQRLCNLLDFRYNKPSTKLFIHDSEFWKGWLILNKTDFFFEIGYQLNHVFHHRNVRP